MFDGIEKVGDNDEGRFFARPIFIATPDVAQGQRGGQCFPFFGGEVTSCGLADWLGPGDESFVGADLFSFAPVEFAVAGLVQSHDDVALFFGDDAGDELVRAKGPVAQDDVTFIDVFEKARGDAGIVFSKAAGLESFDTTVTEVHHANDAHDGKATAFFLTAVLRVGFLIFHGVNEGDFGAIDGFETMTTPKVLGLDSRVERLPDFLVDLNEKAFIDSISGPAIWAGITSGNREFEDSTPGLNHAETFGAAGIGFEKLGQPSPENGDVTEAALAFCGIDFRKEGARKD